MVRWGILVLMLGLFGCSTLQGGTVQQVMVITPEVEGASCKLADDRGGVWYLRNTPNTIQVRRGYAPLTVICEKAGYKKGLLVVQQEFDTRIAKNIVTGGIPGAAVDVVSGASARYPTEIIVWMEPLEWKSLRDKDLWDERKAAYERNKEDEKHRCRFSENTNC